MTTTKEALEIVTQLKAQADAQVEAYTKVSEGHQIIADRLNGIAETPAADYVALQEKKNAGETETPYSTFVRKAAETALAERSIGETLIEFA